MREKAKELQRQRMEAAKKGVKVSYGGSGGFGNSTGYNPTPSVGDMANITNEIKPSYTPLQKSVPTSTRAMKLGGKSRDVESFVDQLKNEGESVIVPTVPSAQTQNHKTPAIKTEHRDG